MPRSNWLFAQQQRDGRMALRQWPMALNYVPATTSILDLQQIARTPPPMRLDC